MSVLLKLGSGIIISKVLAVFVGAEGMALTGNLRNFLTSIESASTLGLQNGILKNIAENRNNESELKKIISTVFVTLLTVVLLLSVVLFSFSHYFNEIIFGKTYAYATIFKVLALALPWYVGTTFLIIIINGFGRFKKVIYINIYGNIIGLIFSLLMIWQYKTFGALLSIIITPSLLFLVAFYFINKDINFIKAVSFNGFNSRVIKEMSPYILMAFVSSVIGPLVFLSIRNNIIDTLGIEQAGYWEAMTRISTYYYMFISTVLTVYFLPKLVFATTDKAFKNVVFAYYKGIMPVFIFGLITIYFLRFFIIKLLFTSAFLPVTGLFLWQLLGDALKAFSLILGYQFFAKKMTVAFVVTEIFSLAIMWLSSTFLIGVFQIEGVVMAHAITYLVYSIVLVIYFRKNLF